MPRHSSRGIRRLAILVGLITGLALPTPSVFAHGNQFICARVTIGGDGHLVVELTADHGGNPNIADAQAARQVLRECLQVELGDRRFPLEHFAPLLFSDRDRYSEDSPVPPAADPGPHHLVTASWQAFLPGQRVVFVAKERTPLDVVMWQANATPAPAGSRWVLLIAGERSPVYATAAGRSSDARLMFALLVFPLLVVFMRAVAGRRQVLVRAPG